MYIPIDIAEVRTQEGKLYLIVAIEWTNGQVERMNRTLKEATVKTSVLGFSQ
ncbi:hypothetical protein RHABOEDO_001504 [Candidatus Rhabdochlamydia oedothoracis]|uniref:Integrase catalytic domain-containing protein n=1 Tax=Candidatus Rhabdochlamydia oedothoracis TaxID=2720720 RepID=A0ABX8V853_9BACT|nr:hypothetical protein [Candidatus Rhabdochlamydia oedothoracis]QYF49210.1 hypothetical protein RHABOEDO_001504 [Candidatus Rhabdochlamydia oedothoracis]